MTTVGDSVLRFYRELPFNTHGTVADEVRSIRAHDRTLAYPVLPPLLSPATQVLEVGCGVGWLANSIAVYHGATVTAIDFNPVAIGRARAVAQALGARVAFEVADVFAYRPPAPVDLAISLGALHHTADCPGAVARMCREFIVPGGRVFVGLYHAHGRRPFLDHFRRLRDAGASEERLFEEYAALDRRTDDTTLLRSWFRDQVLHPHETQHTLREMAAVLRECGMELESTSINRFQPFDSLDALFDAEIDYARLARERLAAGQYFPGFFLFLARQTADNS